MAGICKSFALSCRAKRLAWATSSPDFPVVTPSGRPEGMGPDANACEEMALGESTQVAGVDIFDAPFVHDARRDVPSVDEIAQPLSRERVYLVVVSGGHGSRNEKAPACGAVDRQNQGWALACRGALGRGVTLAATLLRDAVCALNGAGKL